METGQRIVHALKYEGWWRVAEGAASRMARLAWPADVVEERALASRVSDLRAEVQLVAEGLEEAYAETRASPRP
jgi:hypothetical protein